MPLTGPFALLPKYLNPVMTPLSRYVPPLVLLEHRGRRSGRSYQTPVQAFRTADGFIVGLAYDRNAGWALNLLASGSGEMTRAGRRYQLSNVRRRGPDALARLPRWVSPAMRALDIDDFIEFDATPVKK